MPAIRHARRPALATLIAAAMAAPSAAADLAEISPITDRIIALRIGDGRVVSRAVAGQPDDADVLQVSPLAVGALAAGAFRIRSGSHAAYASPVAPVALHRKARGDGFVQTRENWQWNGPRGHGYYPDGPRWTTATTLYLELPQALAVGAQYALTWDAAALNLAGGAATLAFTPATLRSEAIHVNTLGYLPGSAAKVGYLYHWAGDRGGIDYAAWAGRPFRIVDAGSGATRLTGSVAFRAAATNPETAQRVWDAASGQSLKPTPNDNFLSAAVWECDFSALTGTGSFRLVVDGLGCSYPFRIADDIYAEPFRLVMNTLYQNRSGIALVAPWTDEPRPAPHRPGVTPGFAGRLKYSGFRGCDMENTDSGSSADKTAIEAAARGALTGTWGWYQDAGDWDGYITHGKVPIILSLLYLAHPDRFADGQLRLPEAGNGMPDILDEAAWLPRYFRRLRAELLARGWGTGGVGGRVFGDAWGPDSPGSIRRGSWQDVDRDWYVTGEDPFSTCQYAGMAALLAIAQARAGRADPEGVDWAAEARAAYAWARANTRAGDEGRSYEGSLAAYRTLAAAALYRLTGEDGFHQDFLADTAGFQPWSELTDHTLWGVAVYLGMPAERAVDAARATTLRAAFLDGSLNPYHLSFANRALRWSGNWWFPSEIGHATTPLVLPLVLAEPVARPSDPADADVYRTMVQTTCDYFLGGNPLHTTWITRLGPRPPTGIFHMDDWALGATDRAGMIPYGPNALSKYWSYGFVEQTYSPHWGYKTAYPPLVDATVAVSWGDPGAIYYQSPGNWPLHEVWFNQAYAPQTAEFTIHQTQIMAAAAFAALLPAVANRPPAIGAAAAVPAALALP